MRKLLLLLANALISSIPAFIKSIYHLHKARVERMNNGVKSYA